MKEKIIKTMLDLMSFKTYKDNKEEFIKLINYIKNKFNLLNIIEEDINNNKCLIISNYKDISNFDVLFCCHCDVVYTDDWSIKTDNDNVYGRGSIDMKGSLAVCLELMNSINTTKKIGLMITSDEELDGFCCKSLLEKYTSSLAIIPDGGTNFNFIKEEKGLLQLELSIKTKSSHASRPWEGVNAIVELFNVYEKLLKIYPLPKNELDYITSINLGEIKGGNSFNSVAQSCIMKLDIRYTSDTNKVEIINNLKKINKNIDIKVVLESSIFITDLNNENIKKYIDCCSEVLNKKIDIVGCETSSDAVYFYEKNIPTIIMNPIGGNPHCDNEFVNMNSLVDLFNIYKKFIDE